MYNCALFFQIAGEKSDIRSSSPNTSGKNDDSGEKPEKPQKEKKKKDVSVARQKKFYRHFQQVSANEKVINCKSFNCFPLELKLITQSNLRLVDGSFRRTFLWKISE